MITFVVVAAQPATANHLLDRLSPDNAGFRQLASKLEPIFRNADALVEASPLFAPGYIVGVSRKGKAWVLVGHGSQAKGLDFVPFSETGCTLPIEENLARKIVSLWTKALAAGGLGSNQNGLDGEIYTFGLKATGKAGWTWSPSFRYQPKMFSLTQIADKMFAVCVTGKGQGELERQSAQLFVTM